MKRDLRIEGFPSFDFVGSGCARLGEESRSNFRFARSANAHLNAMRQREGSAAGADGAPKFQIWATRPSAEDESWYRSAHHCSTVEDAVEGIREGNDMNKGYWVVAYRKVLTWRR